MPPAKNIDRCLLCIKLLWLACFASCATGLGAPRYPGGGMRGREFPNPRCAPAAPTGFCLWCFAIKAFVVSVVRCGDVVRFVLPGIAPAASLTTAPKLALRVSSTATDTTFFVASPASSGTPGTRTSAFSSPGLLVSLPRLSFAKVPSSRVPRVVSRLVLLASIAERFNEALVSLGVVGKALGGCDGFSRARLFVCFRADASVCFSVSFASRFARFFAVLPPARTAARTSAFAQSAWSVFRGKSWKSNREAGSLNAAPRASRFGLSPFGQSSRLAQSSAPLPLPLPPSFSPPPLPLLVFRT
mmetsp:Transcript_1740/g.6572  ORF Transcript_1740/g.6572 Transcript_1740/m.6572 type:complete len:301 (-) Transcript_1740:346-1248(-)